MPNEQHIFNLALVVNTVMTSVIRTEKITFINERKSQTARPCQAFLIPLRIRNTFQPLNCILSAPVKMNYFLLHVNPTSSKSVISCCALELTPE